MFSATNDNDNVGVGPIDAAEVLYRIASTRGSERRRFDWSTTRTCGPAWAR